MNEYYALQLIHQLVFISGRGHAPVLQLPFLIQPLMFKN